jgi:hypothetical protein
VYITYTVPVWRKKDRMIDARIDKGYLISYEIWLTVAEALKYKKASMI